MYDSAPRTRSAGTAWLLLSHLVLAVCLFGFATGECCAQEEVLPQFPGDLPTVSVEALWQQGENRGTWRSGAREIYDGRQPISALTWPEDLPSITDEGSGRFSAEDQPSEQRDYDWLLEPQTHPAIRILQPWWLESSLTALRPGSAALPLDLDGLFALTAMHSGRVRAVAQAPWVSQAQLVQAQAAFDPLLFSDNRFDSTSDPVENTLTTGGPDRLEDDVVGLDTGLRGQGRQGATYSLGQRFGHKNSNSNFFFPQDQGTARLYANLRKPLLRGRQIDVNRSLILTTMFETQAARAEFHNALQTQLFEVADAYWSLYSERISLLQRRRHLQRAENIAEWLVARQGYDASSALVLRANSTIANRKAELIQADARIRNLESRLRALTNAPELLSDREAEFLPLQSAILLPMEFDVEQAFVKAVQQRPELTELSNRLEAVKVQSRLARDQTKPTLDLVAEGYLAGLQGESDVFGAFADQFSEGRPGYAAGLVYERPIGNRAALAAVRQREFEIAQLSHLLTEATENVRAEVETAIRNVAAARQAALGRQLALDAVVTEVETLQDRWLLLGNDPQLGQLQLDVLLTAQDRLLQEEQNLLQALVQYSRALLEVQRATGSLIRFAS